MLTPGNKKLGNALIWSFSLPSGRPDVCVGMTELCRRHCYARRLEGLRAAMLRRYEKNLALSRRPDFPALARLFLLDNFVRVVRLHVGGDFYSAAYVRKWLWVVRRLPEVRFYAYTHSWRRPRLRPALGVLAAQPNFKLWFSCDSGSGVPARVPAGVRLAWLMTEPHEAPPPGAALVFRTAKLRSHPQTRVAGVRVCPPEDGVNRARPVTCDRCRVCWTPPHPTSLLALPVVTPVATAPAPC